MTTITTNNHRHALVSWEELPPYYREQFDYVAGPDRESPRFVFGYHQWWDTHEFERILTADQPGAWAFRVTDDSPLVGWDGIHTTSHGTAVAIRYDFEQHPDGDHAVLGFVLIK